MITIDTIELDHKDNRPLILAVLLTFVIDYMERTGYAYQHDHVLNYMVDCLMCVGPLGFPISMSFRIRRQDVTRFSSACASNIALHSAVNRYIDILYQVFPWSIYYNSCHGALIALYQDLFTRNLESGTFDQYQNRILKPLLSEIIDFKIINNRPMQGPNVVKILEEGDEQTQIRVVWNLDVLRPRK